MSLQKIKLGNCIFNFNLVCENFKLEYLFSTRFYQMFTNRGQLSGL